MCSCHATIRRQDENGLVGISCATIRHILYHSRVIAQTCGVGFRLVVVLYVYIYVKENKLSFVNTGGSREAFRAAPACAPKIVKWPVNPPPPQGRSVSFFTYLCKCCHKPYGQKGYFCVFDVQNVKKILIPKPFRNWMSGPDGWNHVTLIWDWGVYPSGFF